MLQAQVYILVPLVYYLFKWEFFKRRVKILIYLYLYCFIKT